MGQRFEAIGDRDLDDRTLRVELLAELRRAVRFDVSVWLLTDPGTEVGTSPLADVPSLDELPALVRAKYLTGVNRWTALDAGAVATAVGSDGARAGSRLWTEARRFGVDDIASVAFRDAFGCWGFLDLWRRGGSFTATELAAVAALARAATPALRRSLARTFEAATAPPAERGPAVLLLADDLVPITQTPQVDADLRSLLPTDRDRAPVQASALNVAAQLLAREAGVDRHPARARVHLLDGGWFQLGAARLDGAPAAGASRRPGGAPIAVSLEPLGATGRTDLYGRVIGLSPREADVLRELVTGGDTRAVAERLFVSAHTVQDHLKSMFAKAGLRSRPALVARATGSAATSTGD